MVRLKQFLVAAFVAASVVAGPVVGAITILAGSAQYAHAAVVSQIEVRGNARMDAETVKTYLTIRPGANFSSADIDDSVKALFATGLFTDVAIYQVGRTLVVEVDEGGVVNEVFFEGNKRLKDEVLEGNIQTSPRSTFSEEKVAADVELIRAGYSRVGREDATVSYEIVPLANNRVNVIFRVDEGDKTKIRAINFIGNNNYGERRLRDVMETKPSHIFSWLRNDDIYDPAKIRADEEKLRQFYYNNGYADFQVLSTDVNYDNSGNQYIITISIDEGQRYTFGEIFIDNSIPEVDSAILYPLVETRSGGYYSSRKVEDSIIALTEAFAGRGFAFVQVVPRGNRNFADNTIDVTYQIDEGPRVYIERINIVGNDRTRDHVIRREFDISEGDPLNQVLIQKTKRRLEALGFFETVNITTRPGNSADRVIVTVAVRDKATGEFSIGGGYSTSSGALAEISFSEKNFLGRGQYLRVAGGFGTDEQKYSLNFTEPYFLGYRLEAGFDLFAQTNEATSNRNYESQVLGGNLRLGVPITDNLKARAFYTYQDQQTTPSASQLDFDTSPGTPGCQSSIAGGDCIQGDAPGELSAALARSLDWTKSGVGFSLNYVDLDSINNPSEGVAATFKQTFYGVGGDAQYSSSEGLIVGYMPLLEEADVVGMLRARGGVNVPFSDANYRAQDNFFQGTGDIRGFDSYGFGPRDSITGDALGGLYYWNATAEITFPLPYIPESLGIRGGFFADAGQLWGLDSGSRGAVIAAGGSPNQLDDNTLRASVGASIIWDSPFGPLRFDYAIPVSEAPWDDTREFSFGVSTAF